MMDLVFVGLINLNYVQCIFAFIFIFNKMGCQI